MSRRPSVSHQISPKCHRINILITMTMILRYQGRLHDDRTMHLKFFDFVTLYICRDTERGLGVKLPQGLEFPGASYHPMLKGVEAS